MEATINNNQEYQARMDDLYATFGEVCNGRPLNDIFAVTMVFMRDVHKMLREQNAEVPELIPALTEAYTMLDQAEQQAALAEEKARDAEDAQQAI